MSRNDFNNFLVQSRKEIVEKAENEKSTVVSVVLSTITEIHAETVNASDMETLDYLKKYTEITLDDMIDVIHNPVEWTNPKIEAEVHRLYTVSLLEFMK